MMRRAIVLLAGLGLLACDIPTEPPRWEQTWVLPAERLAISVAELVPPTVGLADDGTVFRFTTSPVAVSATLAEMCGPCVQLDGTTVTKPEFTATLSAVSPLPEDLLAAVLAGGRLELVLEHDLAFDPLRPSADPSRRGYLLLAATSDGALVAGDSISGEDTAFPAGTPLTSSLPIQAVAVAGGLELEIRIHSPEGDATRIGASDTLGVTMAATVVDVSEVTVRVADLELGTTTTALDFAVDDWMLDRIRRGALRFQVRNPFDLTGTLEIRLDTGSRAIERTVSVEPGDFSRRIDLSGAELLDIMGAASVTVTTAGSLSAAGDALTVTPTQELVLEPSFEVVLLMGGSEAGS